MYTDFPNICGSFLGFVGSRGLGGSDYFGVYVDHLKLNRGEFAEAA